MCSLAILNLEYDKFFVLPKQIIFQPKIDEQNIFIVTKPFPKQHQNLHKSLIKVPIVRHQKCYQDLRIFQPSLKQLGLSNWDKLQKINRQIKSSTLETAKCKFGAKMLSRQ